MTERRVLGRPASPGYAAGRVVYLRLSEAPKRRPSGDPRIEATALREAVAGALADTRSLQARVDAEAAEIIAFQVAMLEDDELVAPAGVAIAGGAPADTAWEAAVDAEIAGYAAADDPYFRARTADLQDIRDRVLTKLRPGVAGVTAPRGAIVAANDLPPSRFLSIDWHRGAAVLLTEGSPTSHVAMLARARAVPMIVGLGGSAAALDGKEVLVDAEAGELVIDPLPASRDRFSALEQQAENASVEAEAHLSAPARSADGTRIAMHLNIIGAEELAHLDPAICDGIGLFRTEFCFMVPEAFPAKTRNTRSIAPRPSGRGGGR